MDYLAAQDEILDRLHDDSDLMRARVKRWINIVKNEIRTESHVWSWLEAKGQFTLDTSSNEQPLSGLSFLDVQYVQSLRYVEGDSGTLTGLEPSQFFGRFPNPEDAGGGTPRYWTLWNNSIVFETVPTAAHIVVMLYYKSTPDLVNDTDTFPWPTDFDPVMLKKVEYYGLDFNHDERADRALRDYMTGIRKMKARDSKLTDAEIKMPRRVFGSALLGETIYPAEWRYIG